MTASVLPASPAIDAPLREVLTRFPQLVLVMLFGSVAQEVRK